MEYPWAVAFSAFAVTSVHWVGASLSCLGPFAWLILGISRGFIIIIDGWMFFVGIHRLSAFAFIH
jgi:hypothetical protein